MIVTTHEIMLRDIPDYDKGVILDSLKKGDKVKLLEGKVYHDPSVFGYEYYKVSYKGRVGFVRKDALT